MTQKAAVRVKMSILITVVLTVTAQKVATEVTAAVLTKEVLPLCVKYMYINSVNTYIK